jgi:tetratricopeptide (TPR) repeat protein
LSVGVVLQSRSDLPTHEYQRFADILQAALAKADEDPRQTDILQAVLAKADEDPRQRESVYRVSGFRYLGLCRECTGANRAAAEAYTQGLAIDPDDASLLAARGLVGYGSDPGAIRDLERSVAQSVDFIAPYLYLAHHRFREQRFKDCLQLCDAALRFDGPETIKSELMEWTAIARAELEFPADMVREAFEEAVRLDPSNERALHNRALYEERLASPREEEPGRFEARTPRELRASVPPGFWFRGAA